jgi:hypothetical protein
VINFPTFAQARINALFAAARSAVCLSRILLLLAAVELITMPLTQGLWSWDGFMHGGQDFELSLLMTVTCLCLILLRVQDSDRSLNLFAVIWALLPTARKRAATGLLVRPESSRDRFNTPSRFRAGAFNRPLLI